MIVDEPTAGLDPEERLRFYGLLSELAEDRIVLLSTHIVEDVSVLCPRFAVIRDGRLIANTTPGAARRAIEATIYEGSVPAKGDDQIPVGPGGCLIQTNLFEGRNRVRIYQPEGHPPPGFVPVPATLEDAYLVLIKTGGLNGSSDPVVAKRSEFAAMDGPERLPAARQGGAL
jgi:energy-coupling factor transporter ATP-binding protein EcfA2